MSNGILSMWSELKRSECRSNTHDLGNCLSQVYAITLATELQAACLTYLLGVWSLTDLLNSIELNIESTCYVHWFCFRSMQDVCYILFTLYVTVLRLVVPKLKPGSSCLIIKDMFSQTMF